MSATSSSTRPRWLQTPEQPVTLLHRGDGRGSHGDLGAEPQPRPPAAPRSRSEPQGLRAEPGRAAPLPCGGNPTARGLRLPYDTGRGRPQGKHSSQKRLLIPFALSAGGLKTHLQSSNSDLKYSILLYLSVASRVRHLERLVADRPPFREPPERDVRFLFSCHRPRRNSLAQGHLHRRHAELPQAAEGNGRGGDTRRVLP